MIDAERIQFLRSGSEFFETLLSLIDAAKESLHLQMYIISDDNIGMLVLESLERAAKRGVEIYVVADGFGSRNLSPEYTDRLKNAGINFRFFSRISLFKNLSIGRRMHHKIVVIDRYKALVGGINIADKYFGTNENEPWLDFALLITGNVCEKLEKICNQIVEKKYTQQYTYKHKRDTGLKYLNIVMRQNDWLRNKKQIYQSYNLAIRYAEKSIIIFASYFLPGLRLRRALEAASKRGVQISIVLAGISDIPLAINATYYLYHWLLKHNIRIYEWKKSVLHAKLAIVDDRWMTIGSFNLNYLSTYASIELNIDILNVDFVCRTKSYLNQLIEEGCEEINRNRKRPFLTKIREIIAYFLGRTLIKTITFFPNFRNFYSRMVD